MGITIKPLLQRWVIGSLFLAAFYSPQVLSSQQLSEIDALKTIMIDGADLPNTTDRPIDQFSLAAIVDGSMEPIPFQIDEYNEGGAVYFEGWDVPIAGTEGIFDKEDKLLFIYKDAGPRRQEHHQYDGKIIHEITLTNDSGHTRYVYLVSNSRLRSDEQYVRFSADEALVETDYYSISYNKENHTIWTDFSIVNYSGDHNPFDSLKIRLDTGVITSLAKTRLNNEDTVAIPKAERIGPIRTTTQMELTFWFLKIPFIRLSLQQHHSPKSLLYDIRALLPAARRKMLADPKIYLSLEGNALYGTETRTALGPKKPGITDGVVEAIEQQHIDEGIDTEHNWIWATTLRNLDFVTFFDFIGQQSQKLSLHYMDDREAADPPERFVGQLPNVGYKIHSIPESGFFGFAVNVYLSNGYEGNPDLFTDKLRRLPDISVNSPEI